MKNLGKKQQLPPIKKKQLSFKNDSSIISPSKNKSGSNIYPRTSGKKVTHEEIWDMKTIKTDNVKLVNIKLNNKEEDNIDIKESNEKK